MALLLRLAACYCCPLLVLASEAYPPPHLPHAPPLPYPLHPTPYTLPPQVGDPHRESGLRAARRKTTRRRRRRRRTTMDLLLLILAPRRAMCVEAVERMLPALRLQAMAATSPRVSQRHRSLCPPTTTTRPRRNSNSSSTHRRRAASPASLVTLPHLPPLSPLRVILTCPRRCPPLHRR